MMCVVWQWKKLSFLKDVMRSRCDVEYAAATSESEVRGAGDAGVVVTYLDRITVESSGAESRRKILACAHVEENDRREEYSEMLGSLSEKTADKVLPTGASQRRGELELPLPGPQHGRGGDGNTDAA